MAEEFVTVKIWKKTLSKLRLIAATRERSMVSVLEDMVKKNMLVSASGKDKKEKWEPVDEQAVCDLCGKQFWFSKGVIYYIDGEPKLLCSECVKAKEMANKLPKKKT